MTALGLIDGRDRLGSSALLGHAVHAGCGAEQDGAFAVPRAAGKRRDVAQILRPGAARQYLLQLPPAHERDRATVRRPERPGGVVRPREPLRCDPADGPYVE